MYFIVAWKGFRIGADAFQDMGNFRFESGRGL
jgi:hypothetical protein